MHLYPLVPNTIVFLLFLQQCKIRNIAYRQMLRQRHEYWILEGMLEIRWLRGGHQQEYYTLFISLHKLASAVCFGDQKLLRRVHQMVSLKFQIKLGYQTDVVIAIYRCRVQFAQVSEELKQSVHDYNLSIIDQWYLILQKK